MKYNTTNSSWLIRLIKENIGNILKKYCKNITFFVFLLICVCFYERLLQFFKFKLFNHNWMIINQSRFYLPLLRSPPRSSPCLSFLRGLSSLLSLLGPSFLDSRLAALSYSPFFQDYLVRNSPSALRGAWYPGAFFSSAVGFLVKVISTTVKNLYCSTLTNPYSFGSNTSTILFSVMLMIWWRSGTFLLTTSATHSALSMTL